jgi:hypothetical protein
VESLTVDPLAAAVIVLAVLVVLLFAAGAGLYRRIRELELATYRGVGLTLGGADGATGSVGADLSRGLVSPGRTTIVLKLNRRCAVCDELLAALPRISLDLPTGLRLVVLSDDAGFDREVPDGVDVIRDAAAWRAVTVPYVPAIVVVDDRATVVYTAPAGSAGALDDVVRRMADRKEVDR